MDLQNEWNNMSEEFKSSETSPAITTNTIQKESKGLYETLRKNLGYKLMWLRILSVPMLIGAFYTEGGLRYLLLSVFLVYEISHMLMARKLKHMPPGLDYSEVTKLMLVRQLEFVKEILKAEQMWGYVFIPIAAPLGLIAYQFFTGKEIAELYNGPHFVIYAITVVVFAGLGLLMGKKMNDIAFSKYIKKLNENIEQMN